MIFYNETGEKIDYHLLKRIGGGSYSRVYMLPNDSCIKVFKEIDNGIDKNNLSFINNLKLDNFYQINDFLFDGNNNFAAYTMNYYRPSNDSILLMPTMYTLDNLNTIGKSIGVLTDNHIFIPDLHSDNVITGDNNITVIDTDIYAKSLFFDKDKLEVRNYRALYCLFKMLYKEALYCGFKYCDDDIDNINNLFDYNNADNVKTLRRYKYPIDYIRSTRR